MFFFRALLLVFLPATAIAASGQETTQAPKPATAPVLSARPAEIKPLGPPHAPNSNVYYQQLRHLQPSGAMLSVANWTLKRDAAIFTFHSGGFSFYTAVNGKITGAVFHGDGSLHLVPPTPEEKRSISLLTKAPMLDETFQTAVFRFTDNTAAEIRKASSGTGSDGAAYLPARKLADELQTEIHSNLDARILQDVLSPAPGGLFVAWIEGRTYSSKMMFTLDPHGAEGVAPEEVKLETWNDTRRGIWTAFHLEDEFTQGRPQGTENNRTFAIANQSLDTAISKGGKIDGTARTTLIAQQDGLAVIPLALFPTLRASSAMGPDGTELDFVQENKERDPDFAVILPTPLKRGQSYLLTITYSGKDAVENVGGDNYYPVPEARERWYPNMPSGALGGYATYDMTFRVPRGLEIIATGEKTRQVDEGAQTITEWKTDFPIAVAGFNLGKFRKEQATLKSGMVIDAYANEEVPDFVHRLSEMGTMGTMTTTGMLKPELAQGEVATALYSDYFGPLQYRHIALSQQTACNYGQSWPMLVYLPICGFWDTTIRHQLGLDRDLTYWKIVTPHEVAHQWWGQTVGFRSYRDQWMSEGFADFSASLFLQFTRKDTKDFRDFWKEQRRLMTERNAEGFRPIDVGPVTMGFRLENTKSGGSIYPDLVYPKGAYILHMVRMMMWTHKEHDQYLKDALQDFISANRNRAASTEDFKAALERHMTPAMDLDHNGRLDWFFDEFVYGTALPNYQMTSDVHPNEKGTEVAFKLTQGNVTDNFKMLVPIYLELNNGDVLQIGEVAMHGNSSAEKKVQLPPMASPVKRVIANYFYDVLSTEQ